MTDGLLERLERAAAEAVRDCIHCGFCLPACPTYELWREEPDSPRGRIQLVDARLKHRVDVDDAYRTRFDHCLGCMACVTACPSGVRFDRIIEFARADLGRRAPRRGRDRLLEALAFRLFPYRRRLRLAALALIAYRGAGRPLARGPVKTMEALAPRLTVPAAFARLPRSRARLPVRGRVVLVQGCVQAAFLPRVNAATVRVLNAEGWEVAVGRQGCCGALSLHQGRVDEAAAFAARMVAGTPLTGVEAVIVNAAGCGSALKESADLVTGPGAQRFGALVQDVAEFLARHEPVAERQPLPLRVAYHDACHLSHAQGIRIEPRTLLRAIPRLELLDIPDAAMCCGSAGLYNLLEPEAAEELGRRKAQAVMALGVDVVVTGNPGCALQLGRHLRAASANPPVVLHTVELLDASIRGEKGWTR